MVREIDLESESAQVAVILEDPASETTAIRLARVLDFLGIPWDLAQNITKLREHAACDSLRGKRYAVLAPLTAVPELRATSTEENGGSHSASTRVHSIFAYLTSDPHSCSELLRTTTGRPDARLCEIEGGLTVIKVTASQPALTGPMHAIQCTARAQPSDWVLVADGGTAISPITESSAGTHFFSLPSEELPIFVNCSSEIPDIAEPLKGRYYDVKEDFLSAVPLLIYLKWAFRDVCWQPAEAGACLIVDDPLLKTSYGFCDFRRLDAQMQEHSFSTNIAFIPWNWRRTSPEMATLVKQSAGRLSVSIHGCDHTKGEFGSSSVAELEAKVGLAKWRMEQHRQRTGISHDSIMVFPQGVFSKESLLVLQRNGFAAAVNTELTPNNDHENPITVQEAWGVAILRYGGLPLFTRRYPAQGLENFAFDLLLGKPCLIVAHHEFFKGDGEAVVKFVNRLNALNCQLRWRSLGDVIRRSLHWRLQTNGTVQARMFANEAVLTNTNVAERDYHIQKNLDRVNAGRKVLADRQEVEWRTEADSMTFDCKVSPGKEVLINTLCDPAQEPTRSEYTARMAVKIAVRRLLSEFRDNVLSRREPVMLIAQKAKMLVRA